MGKIISLVSPKGGVTKSTLALCLASAYGNSCIVDMDRQGSLDTWFHDRQNRESEGYEQDVRIQVEFYGQEELTDKKLMDLAGQYEYVIIDCPGESEAGEKTRTALVYSDLVIIPINESEFDLNSLLDHLVPLLDYAKEANPKGRFVLLPVFCHVNAGLEKTIAKFKPLELDVVEALFRYRTVFKRFAENGQTLEKYSENATTARERIRARAALSDVNEIVLQLNNHLR
ncbi:ParA family protein [bacterium]|nr:ParA family protein [bacterium]